MDAILSGRLSVMKDVQDQTILISGKEGADYFLDQNTNVSGSFAGMNPLSSRVLCATARRGSSQAFTVDALSTDGGCIPPQRHAESRIGTGGFRRPYDA